MIVMTTITRIFIHCIPIQYMFDALGPYPISSWLWSPHPTYTPMSKRSAPWSKWQNKVPKYVFRGNIFPFTLVNLILTTRKHRKIINHVLPLPKCRSPEIWNMWGNSAKCPAKKWLKVDPKFSKTLPAFHPYPWKLLRTPSSRRKEASSG